MRSIFNIIKTTLNRVLLLDVLSDRSSWPAFAWAGIWIIIGTILFHYIEGWTWLDALYFCVVTLATVGYGDFTPTTPLGKILAMFYIINGIGILLYFIDKVMQVRKERGVSRRVKFISHTDDNQAG